jgi:hypothetical protein
MTDLAPGSIVGYVLADSRSFWNGRFRPINDAHAEFHVGTREYKGQAFEMKPIPAILSPLEEGEFYCVQEEMDKSEGRGAKRCVDNFLVYQDAVHASLGLGVQGSSGPILIGSINRTREITVITEGVETVFARIPEITYYPLYTKLIIENPFAPKNPAS